MTTTTISARLLREFTADLFSASDVPASDAVLIAKSLVDANLCGHESHGVIRILEYVELLAEGSLKKDAELQINSETPALAVCDGQFGFGQIQMRRLIDKLLPKAEQLGQACGTIRNCGHVGRLAEWCEKIAGLGLASLLTVNDNGVLKCVAPPGGTTPVISTNPVAIGVPGDPPLVVDASTSVVANGKIRVAQIAGENCPEGWLIDSEGNATTDPDDRFADPPGSILPMGGYKGFGLGLLLDSLVGGLSGGQCPPAPDGTVECNNVLLVVFSPKHFGGVEHFSRQLQDLVKFSRNSQPIVPGQPIRLPGDRSTELRASRLANGIPLDAGTWGELCELAKRMNVEIPV